MNLYGYNADTGVCQLYDRDAENEVGFSTDMLDMRTAARLAKYVEKLYQDGVRYGRASISGQIRGMLDRAAVSDV